MIIKVDDKKVKITKRDSINSGELNVHNCNFVFSSDYDGLIKKAVFTDEDNQSYSATIEDDKCSIPASILIKKGNVRLGVYGYEMQGDILVLRYSPIPTKFYVSEGSYTNSEISMVIDTSEGNITSSDVKKDKIAFSRGEKIIGAFVGETKNVKSTEATQIVTPQENKYYNEIIVQPMSLETKNITPTTSELIIEPGENYDGIKRITVDAIQTESKNVKSTTQSQTVIPTENKFINEIIVEPIILETKNVEITQNGTTSVQAGQNYDGIETVIVTTNVSGAKAVLPAGFTFKWTPSTANNVDWLADVDTSNLDGNELFFGYSNLVNLSSFDTSSFTTMREMCSNCSSLTNFPNFDTSNVTTMYQMCKGCQRLTTFPVLDVSSVNKTGLNYAFTGCGALTNESLNNILKMCDNIPKMDSKQLATLGLTQAQANVCVTLSNWLALEAKGWTTGY